jgi:hypothetical protein
MNLSLKHHEMNHHQGDSHHDVLLTHSHQEEMMEGETVNLNEGVGDHMMMTLKMTIMLSEAMMRHQAVEHE